MRSRWLTRAFIVATALAGAAACNSRSPFAGMGPSPVVATPAAGGFAGGVSMIGTQSVSFPPRNEPFDFRNQLEAKYRDGLRRRPNSSYVDTEGDIVWTTEYLRYRVNACDHASAVTKVMAQIDGRGVQPVCGDAPSGQVNFPPRNEPFDFRQQLEVKYRDILRRSPTSTYVDTEGDIVWTSEYLRYRLNGCDHATGVQKTLQQIDGAPTPAVCSTSTTPTPTPTPIPSGPQFSTITSVEIRLNDGENVEGQAITGTIAGGTPVLFVGKFVERQSGLQQRMLFRILRGSTVLRTTDPLSSQSRASGQTATFVSTGTAPSTAGGFTAVMELTETASSGQQNVATKESPPITVR